MNKVDISTLIVSKNGQNGVEPIFHGIFVAAELFDQELARLPSNNGSPFF